MSTPRSSRRQGCPLCGQPPTLPHAPFCSQGCKDRDLLNWLGDSYRVPGPPADMAAQIGETGLDSEATRPL